MLAAVLSWAAALVHAVAATGHFGEWWAYGAFFTVLVVFQFGWASFIYGRRPSRRVLIAGAAVNLAVVLVWIVTRTTGLPLGPGAGDAEAVGPLDIVATLDELGIALAVAISVGALHVRRPALRALGPRLAFSLAVVSGALLLVGTHAH